MQIEVSYNQKLFSTVNQAQFVIIIFLKSIIFFPTKDANSGVQKIEGPLWKVPRCWSVFFSTLHMSGNVFVHTPPHLTI